jgi:hypothetical protein
MTKELFNRFTELAEKALIDNATDDDLKELKTLMDKWVRSTELNRFGLPMDD